MTPKGQMSGNGSGPAIMMMPPHIRATFMPNPPIAHLPPVKRRVLQSDNYVTEDDDDDDTYNDGAAATTQSSSTTTTNADKKKKTGPSGVAIIPHSFPKFKRPTVLSGVSSFLQHFERSAPPARTIQPTPKSIREQKRKIAQSKNEQKLKPLIEKYKSEQTSVQSTDGIHPTSGMNCYHTLFVGRLAYEVTERKLLREFEQFGPVKDVKIISRKNATGIKKSKGYGFVEYEHEEDMKRAYRGADGMKLEGRCVVVDVERGHTVPNWLPRRLGGGLGGTRLGGKDKNIFYPGRFDPSKPTGPPPNMMPPMGPGGGPPGYGPPPPHPPFGGPPGPGGYGPPPPQGYGRYDHDRNRRFDDNRNNGPPGRGRYDNGPPMPGRHEDRGGSRGGGGYDDRKRRRSRSPDRDRRRGRY